MNTDVVVLAGGRSSPEMMAVTGTKNRALTLLGARTMLDYVAAALHETPSLGRIFVVGTVPESSLYTVVPEQKSLLDNLMAGLSAAGDQPRVLVSTSDIPFVTPAALEDFTARASATGAALCCSYVPLAACTAAFPEMKRTAIKTAEGRFTLGNVMLVSPSFLAANRSRITGAYDARKSPAKVASLLGYPLLARMLGAQILTPRLLPLHTLEAAVSSLLGGKAVGICSAYPELGTDIDKPADFAAARRRLAGEHP